MQKELVYLEDIKTTDLILKELPDKEEWNHTTSKLFKLDLMKFFSLKPKKKIIEFGCSSGLTSIILSNFATNFVAVDRSEELLNVLRQNKVNLPAHLNFNPDYFSNIEILKCDLYDENFAKFCENNIFEVVFIDAKHELEYLKTDLSNAEKLGANTIILDDYGIMPAVVKHIQENYVETGEWTIRYIGYPPGSYFEGCKSVLSHWEGVILEKNNENSN
tara:strand:+ start:142 stop:795 length:654 start_codon:yes stop_codon:yes gene_type:complete